MNREEQRAVYDYGIEETARQQCRTLGLSPEEAQSYVRQGAPFSHPDFNRRYNEFVFKVERRTIVAVGLFDDNSPRTLLRAAGDAQALALLENTLAWARELSHSLSLAFPLFYGASLYQFLRNSHATLERADSRRSR